MGDPMLKTIPQGSETTMTGTDSALKPRLRRRSTFEYVASILQRGNAWEVLRDPKEPRMQAFQEQVL
jgi:hypothetical protein